MTSGGATRTGSESLFKGTQIYIGYTEATSSINILESCENRGAIKTDIDPL